MAKLAAQPEDNGAKPEEPSVGKTQVDAPCLTSINEKEKVEAAYLFIYVKADDVQTAKEVIESLVGQKESMPLARGHRAGSILRQGMGFASMLQAMVL